MTETNGILTLTTTSNGEALTVVSRTHSQSSCSADTDFDEEANMQKSPTEKGPSISLTENLFINSVTRSDMHMKRNLFVGFFVSCILLTLIMIKVYNYKGMTILAATKHEPYVEALGLFHQSNKFSTLKHNVNEAAWSPYEFRTLHQHIMDGVHEKLTELNLNLTSEIAIIKDKLKALEEKLDHFEAKTKLEAEAIERGIVIRNLPAVPHEHTFQKVYELFREGLGVSAKVDKAHRRMSPSEDPSLIVVLETVEDQAAVLNARQNLGKSASFHDVKIEPYTSHDARITMENMRTLIRAIGKDGEIVFRNGMLVTST
ncbi:uncharacterized protein LOC100374544 [Saccoglossus kowalevskii]|uniref:Uncharacterized protein LOC100374544 n=1 Tax=Saccoglossus kowalevskii TaxID=10224 RepID=A0ABM0GX94_SACKO|nr:PREDICTED: uncharacterized protein LOC100374544 [Saccoglossus kowalevskii]